MSATTNTKGTPKSCSCGSCRRGKGTKSAKDDMRHKQRAYRHACKVELARSDDPVLGVGHVGSYYD